MSRKRGTNGKTMEEQVGSGYTDSKHGKAGKDMRYDHN
jgi:hypothetical protein